MAGSEQAGPDAVVDRAGFAAELARLKWESGLSFRALAKRTEASGVPLLPFTTIRDYVQGRSLPSPARLDAVLTAFGVPVDDPVRARWRAALARAVESPTRPSPDLRPYRGARPVVEGLRGRAAEVAEVLARVRTAPPGGVVVVTGPSGVGVSSLLGAVAAELPGVRGAGSAAELATLLAGDAPFVLVDDVHAHLDRMDRRDPLHAALRVLLEGEAEGGPRVLVGVREGVLDGLCTPNARPVAPVRLTGPSAEGLRAIITEPAAAAGFPLVDGVAELVLGELEVAPHATASPPGALALVARVLEAAWGHAVADGGPTVTIAHYRATGGVYGVAEQIAEEALAALSPERLALARPILIRLVRPHGTTATAQPARRRGRRSALFVGLDAVAAVEMTRTVEALVDARLLTEGEDTLELAHDAFLAWPRLVEWVREDQRRRPARGMLTEATRTWVDAGRTPDALLGGRRLDAALALQAEHQGLFPVERALLAASVAARRRARMVRVAMAVMAALLVAAVVTVGMVVLG
jgi:transcriptional regulator with XRE-family HTH domain